MPYITGNAAALTSVVDNVTLEANSVAQLGTSQVGQIGDVKLSVYPNPATDVLTVNSASKVKAAKVYDVTGKQVNASVQGNQIDVKNLAKGVYILNVSTEKGSESVKFIKK
ncbi:T9SS C-terminal target domain-containing protein [Kaistella haifensis]|nr:T9SS C-terminal target domain-containing protein [Kaistella haifensis]